ncbi:MAG: MraY family glycosyltransferase [Pseudomonadota bacterium]
MAIVLTFFLGMSIIYFVAEETMIRQKFFLGFTFSSLLIAGISFYDDLKHRPLLIRLLTQMLAVCVVIAFGLVINRIEYSSLPENLGLFGYMITFIWIIGLTNAYNFMDGLNGMAGGNAIIASLFLGLISFWQGSNFTYIVCYILVAGTAGFLIFNFPKGRLFMGDVGSTFLGFTFANMAILSSLYDQAHTSLLVIPLLLFHFIYDTAFTFIRRLINKENVFQAHRTHLCQLFNRLGFSHTIVTSFYMIVGLLQGLGAIWMINIYSVQRLYIFIPYLLFQLIYSSVIIYFARKNKLI